MATQAELLTQTRYRLNETTATFWTDEQLRIWINEAARDIARRSESLRSSSTIAVVAGTASYAFAPTQPPTRLHLVEFTPTGQSITFALEYRDRMNMREVWGAYQSVSTGYPAFYTTWGAPGSSSPSAFTIQLYPIPSVAGTLTVHYYRFPVQLATATTSSASSTVEIPGGWEDLIVEGCEYRALRKDRDPAWTEAKQEYEQHLADLYDISVRYNDQIGLVTAQSGAMMPGWAFNAYGGWGEDW